MSRLAGFYIAKAMESVAAGTTAPASAIPPRRAGDHAALDASYAPGRRPATSHRVAAAGWLSILAAVPQGGVEPG